MEKSNFIINVICFRNHWRSIWRRVVIWPGRRQSDGRSYQPSSEAEATCAENSEGKDSAQWETIEYSENLLQRQPQTWCIDEGELLQLKLLHLHPWINLLYTYNLQEPKLWINFTSKTTKVYWWPLKAQLPFEITTSILPSPSLQRQI